MRLFIKFVVVSKCKRTLTENMQYLLYITKKQKKKNQNKTKAIDIASRNECNKCH